MNWNKLPLEIKHIILDKVCYEQRGRAANALMTVLPCRPGLKLAIARSKLCKKYQRLAKRVGDRARWDHFNTWLATPVRRRVYVQLGHGMWGDKNDLKKFQGKAEGKFRTTFE